MLFAGILIAELLILFFLALRVTQAIFEFFLLLFRSRTVAVTIVLLLEFPGTVVHELAHLFTAEILRVPTGKMNLVPETIRGNEITSGSVMIGSSGPFRRYAIGLAPLFAGILILTSLSYFLPSLYTSVIHSIVPRYTNPDFYWLLLTSYCLFVLSITMFPSPADVKGILPFAGVVTIFVLGAFFLGLRLTLSGWVLDGALTILMTLTKSLGLVIVFNVAILIVMHLMTTILSKLTRSRLYKQT